MNLEPRGQELSKRTLETYQALFMDDELAAEVMQPVTAILIARLKLNLSRQRLDSTPVNSNMAEFGRTRLLAVTVQRFLAQVKRHDPAAYAALDSALCQRYTQSWLSFFGAVKSSGSEGRRQLSLQVARDMHLLLARFENDPQHNQRQSFGDLATVFQQRGEVALDQIVLRKEVGGAIIVNPSDPEATLDGHKGSGYQVQLCETCHADNEAQLITAALPQTAVMDDQSALPLVLDDLKAHQYLPQELIADTGYGRDENVQLAQQDQVELLSPVAGKASRKPQDPDRLRLSEFDIDPQAETVRHCPAGHAPIQSVYDPQTDCCRTTMSGLLCCRCPLKQRCRSHASLSGQAHFFHYGKERRLEKRRDYEQTEEFAQRYRIRSGIESTNGGLKRRMGLGRLRVRGQKAVKFALLLRMAGWNLLRAAQSGALRQKAAA